MQKKTLILITMVLLSMGTLYAQSEIDSLRKVLTTQDNDSNKVKTYLYFFFTDLYYSNPDEVIQFTKEAMRLSQQVDFITGEVDAYNTLGYMHRIRSENDSALFYFNKGAKASEEVEYVSGMADAYSGIGNTYNQLGDWQRAVPNFEKVISIAEAARNNSLVASANNNIGNIYLSKGAYIKALEHYQKGVDLGNPSIKETALINIGLVHQQLEDFGKARKYLEESITLCEKSGNKYALAFVYQHLGTIEQQAGNYSLAIDYFNKATQIFSDINERFNVSDIKTNLANLYYERGNYKEALVEYRESIRIQTSIDHLVGICNNLVGIGKVLLAERSFAHAEDTLLLANQMADSLELLPAKSAVSLLLSALNKKQGHFSKALAYYELHKTLSDSLTNLDKSELVAEMEAKYEVSQKEQEIDLLSAENQVANLQLQKQQNLRNYLLILAIVLVLLVAVGYSRYQLKVRANQKLKDLDHIKSNFFTNISHEFRTPLTLILNPIEKILKNPEQNDVANNLHLVQRNAERLLELTNQILDLSKLEAGKLHLAVEKNELEEFFSVCIASFESLAQSKNIAFDTDVKQAPKTGYFDRDNVAKILNNLLSNAFKFTPEGGSVVLVVKEQGAFMQIEVIDSGSGISPEEQEKIFERFHQNHENEQHGGSGIGLTLTKELVLLHHGTLSVESTVGKGSSFTARIPILANAYSKEETSTVANMNIAPAKSYNNVPSIVQEIEKTDVPVALIVEDNTDLRSHIKSLLQASYHIIQAKNGAEGLDKAIELIPDIIISDWMMPEMDGLELCHKLKKDDRTSHIPIIMLTAKADLESKLDGLTNGADEYLAKPFNTDELLIRIDNLIQQREQLRAKFSRTISIAPSKVDVSDPDEIFIQKVLTIVEQHLSDTDFTVEKLQREMGMSRMQLHRKLKALTHFSASEFIRDLRLQRASDLLAANGATVADVAYNCGFNSLSYFSQCFKEKFGVTPSQYDVEVS